MPLDSLYELEEKAADRELSRIAEAEVNALAAVAGTEEAVQA